MTTTESGQPQAGNAGAGDALERALSAAVDALPDAVTFAPGVADKPSITPPQDQPIDETAPENAATSDTTGEQETAEQKAARLRDDKGRFAKDGEAAKPDAKAAKDKGQAEKPVTEPAAKPATAMSAPAHWDAKTREAFGELKDPKAQKAMLDMARNLEGIVTRKSMELSADADFARGIRSLITDGHRAQMRAAGLDEVRGVKYLLDLNDWAARDAGGYVRWVLGRANLDPRQAFPELSGAEMPMGEQPQAIPAQFHHLIQAATAPLQSELDAIKREKAEQTRRAQAAEYGASIDATDRFRDAVDSAGNPLHPHYERVRTTMAEFLNAPTVRAIRDINAKLAEMYRLAVDADPELRAQFFDAELARRESERRAKEDLAKAQRAKPVIASAPTVAGKAKPKNLDDAVRQAMSSVLGA